MDDQQYLTQIAFMAEQFRKWRLKNKTTLIRFHTRIPKNVWMACDLATALDKKLLVVNNNCRGMMDELGWTADKRDMPTLMMTIMALEQRPTNYGKRKTKSG